MIVLPPFFLRWAGNAHRLTHALPREYIPSLPLSLVFRSKRFTQHVLSSSEILSSPLPLDSNAHLVPANPRTAPNPAPHRKQTCVVLIPYIADTPPSPVSTRFPGRVFDIAFCPWDDQLFASASEDETARVWRDYTRGGVAAGRQDGGGGVAAHGVCRGHKDEVVRVAWHSTMKILATGSADGVAGIWRVAQPGIEETASAHDPEAGTVVRLDFLEGHPGEVYGCAFVGDGGGAGPMLAAAAGTDLHFWDLEAGKKVTCVKPVDGEVSGKEASEDVDMKEGGSGGGDGGGAEKDPGGDNRNKSSSSGGAVPKRWQPGYLFSLSSDGGARGLLASACSDGSVRLWGHDSSARSARGIASLPLHQGSLAASTAFLSGGDILASLSTDGSVILTDVRKLTPVRKVTAPCPLMACCAVPSEAGATGSWLAMCGHDGSVRALDASGVGGTKLLKPTSAAEEVGGKKNQTPQPLLCVAADSSGRRVAAAGTPMPALAPIAGFGGGLASGRIGGVGPMGAKKRPNPAGIHIWDASV